MEERERIIGKLVLEKDQEFTKTYECAAWFKRVLVKAGAYDLIGVYKKNEYSSWHNITGEFERVYAELPGLVTGSNFSSYFCGNMIGNGKFNEDVGKEDSYYWTTQAYSLAHTILRKEHRDWTIELDDKTLAVEYPFMTEYNGWELCETAKLIDKDENLEYKMRSVANGYVQYARLDNGTYKSINLDDKNKQYSVIQCTEEGSVIIRRFEYGTPWREVVNYYLESGISL